MKKSCLLIMSLLSFSSLAIDYTYTDNCGQPGAPASPACEAFDAEVRQELDDNIPNVTADKYADGTANANVIANTGKGSDYGQHYDLLSLKLTPIAIGVDASDGGLSKPEDAGGFAIGGGVAIGLNMKALPVKKLGFLDLSRLSVMFNFMSLERDQSSGNLDISGKISGLGLMARYDLIKSTMGLGKLAGWGGVQLHTGIQTAKMKISAINKLDDQTFTESGITGNFTNGIIDFDLDANTTTIPIEVSTYFRFLYVFTLYGGAGVDFTSGSSDITFKASGNITANGGGGTYNGVLNASEEASGKPDTSNLRAFVGLQLNVPVVSLFIHLNKHVTQDVIGLNTGLNISW